jgi:hypothetical protein
MFVIVETFLNPGEPSSAVFRVRPIPGQAFPPSMRVQCSRAMRHAFPLGSRFRLPIRLVERYDGTKFLSEIGHWSWAEYLEDGY